ncbi:MAG: formyltransferase family protein, partial [Longimicrobiales bacterium]
MTENIFSCFLIGGDTLLIQCAEILRTAGHEIRGVVTASPDIRAWCDDQGIATIDTGDDYASAMAAEPFDYLFSITHLAIIPTEVLELPRKLSVNFHDGPLPRYAGLNTPVWALINGEPEYGISWHVMTAGVDKGDILKQEMFEVTSSETALSINTRCMAAAVDTFPVLVAELAEGSETRTPQDGTLRSYFGKYTRPEAVCTVDWSKPAAAVDALVRALNFGPYANPVGAAKTLVDEPGASPFLVASVEIGGASPEGQSAGEILDVSADAIVVATGDGGRSITEERRLHGDD